MPPGVKASLSRRSPSSLVLRSSSWRRQIPSSSLHGSKYGGTEPETTQEVDANKILQPEDSRNFSAGFVYTPKWIHNWNASSTLTLSVDFWDVERTGVVTTPAAQALVGHFSTTR